MTPRSPDQLCLLCLHRKATKTGSHYTPNAILKHTIGKRDYEQAYTIDVDGPATSVHYGKSNLNGVDQDATPNPHVADYIFCPECEKQLGDYESYISPLIDTSILSDKKRHHVVPTEISPEVMLLEFSKANFNAFVVFILSLIWRICLQQRLDNGTVVVSAQFTEELRCFLTKYICIPPSQIVDIDMDIPNDFILIASAAKDKITPDYVNPDPEITNPQLFYVGPLVCMVYHVKCAVTSNIASIPQVLVDRQWANQKKHGIVRTIDVTNDMWLKLHNDIIEYNHQEYIKTMVTRIARHHGITQPGAQIMLDRKAKGLVATGDAKDGIESINAAYDQLMAAIPRQ